MAGTVNSRAKLSPPEAARRDLDAALLHVQEVAAQKYIALRESDSAWAGWGRQWELANAEVLRLKDLVAQLEAEAAAAEAKAKRDHYRRRFDAQAAENAAVTECLQTDFSAAWEVLARTLERQARAEIATQQLVADMPDDFDPGEAWIGNPEMAVRWRPPVPEKVLSRKVVKLWCDPKTGRPFVDQSREPTVTANRRQFMEVTYQQFSPAATVPRFYSALVMPRIDAIGEPIMFDGSKMRGPHDVLAALEKIRQRVQREAVVLVKHEPVGQVALPVSQTDVPPAITEEVARRSE